MLRDATQRPRTLWRHIESAVFLTKFGRAEDRHVRLPRAFRIDWPRSHDAPSEVLLRPKRRIQFSRAMSEYLKVKSGVIGG